MIANAPQRRAGYTLLELIVVLAVVILLGAIVLPTLFGTQGNTRVKAAADDCTSSISMARSHAIDEGRNYKLSVSSDGTKIRVSPDDPAALDASTDPDLPKPYVSEKTLEPGVTIKPIITGSESSMSDTDGWIRLATFQQDGTCKEAYDPDFEIAEVGVTSLIVQIRALTGHTTVNPAAKK
jgi:Tfp pilus assembly protein FimT